MANIWNSLEKKKKAALLREAGYNPNAYINRVFEFLPKWVREDVDYVYRRQTA